MILALSRENADTIDMPGFHRRLATFNRRRLSPVVDGGDWRQQLRYEAVMRSLEAGFIESERKMLAGMIADVPSDPDGFVAWFESLRNHGPGQNDALFPWLAEQATIDQLRWFLAQEVSSEAGFDDLVAMTQVRFPIQAKLELARNYWDEMGRGRTGDMHGVMLNELAAELGLQPDPDAVVWEALALANLMVGLAANRHYAFQSLGALGVIEMTAPGRVAQVDQALQRLGLSARSRRYFAVHAVLDLKHSADWNREVLRSLVVGDPRCARPLAEGALMRLEAGRRCFARYRQDLGVAVTSSGVESHARTSADGR